MQKIIIILIVILVVLVGLLYLTANSESIQTYDDLHDEANPVATIVLKQGDKEGKMTFELYPDLAPESVNNFIYLANSQFYDGLTMHRLVSDFVVQGGDPDGTGAGGPGYSIVGEFPSNGYDTGLTHQKGALAWARSGEPDSAGSQFYIALDDVPMLDEDYAVFGYMIDGYDVLDYINTEIEVEGESPTEELTIKSVSVDTKGQEYPEANHI